MSKPETCVCCGRVIPENSHYCVICGMGKPKKQRQIDRIRGMSVEELAKLLNEHIPPYRLPKQVREIYNNNSVSFYGAWLLWLESEVEGE